MGTEIRLEISRNYEDKTTDEQWSKLVEYIESRHDHEDFTIEQDLIYGYVKCSYSMAYINKQIPEELREELKGSGIVINMWYEERDPDDYMEL